MLIKKHLINERRKYISMKREVNMKKKAKC